MSKRIFNEEQIETLLQNSNVVKCSKKSITYDKDFKVLAIKKYQEGLPSSEIFKQAEFDIDLIGHKTPKECLHRWRRVFKDRGNAGLEIDGRQQNSNNPQGRPKNLANLTNEEKLKRLRTEVAYLKKENHFLAKLRKESLN